MAVHPDEAENKKLDDYLMDPRSEPEESVVRLERLLMPFRYDSERLTLDLPSKVTNTRRRRRRPLLLAAAIACALVIAALGAVEWIWSWPNGRPWTVAVSGDQRLELGPGDVLQVGPQDSAVAWIARIGRMEVGPGSEVRLIQTADVRHRLQVERGNLSIGVWAPPFSVGIHTPAGVVYDMGCAFDLAVRDDVSHVRVRSGWVQMENAYGGGVMVPEGAESRMYSNRRGSVPVYLDASPAFRAAVARVENDRGTQDDVQTIITSARRRDVYTILLLAERPTPWREQLVSGAAKLVPPPSKEIRARVAQGDLHAVWAWVALLDLPPPKGWIRNWRDFLPGRTRSWG